MHKNRVIKQVRKVSFLTLYLISLFVGSLILPWANCCGSEIHRMRFVETVTRACESQRKSNEITDPLQPGIADKILRLHVLANSDSKEDQEVKKKVRDAVGAMMEPKLAGIPLPEYMEAEEKNAKTYRKLFEFLTHYIRRKSTIPRQKAPRHDEKA